MEGGGLMRKEGKVEWGDGVQEEGKEEIGFLRSPFRYIHKSLTIPNPRLLFAAQDAHNLQPSASYF